MYLTGAELIDMTLKQLEMLEEILRADSKTGRRARDPAAEKSIATSQLCERRRVVAGKSHAF